MVAWAKDKEAESVEISYGQEKFQPYISYYDRYSRLKHPVKAFFARGTSRSTSPGLAVTRVPSAVPVPESPAVSDEAEVSSEPSALTDDSYTVDPAAVTAAASRGKSVRATGHYDQKFKFRTAPEPSSTSRVFVILVTLLLLAGGALGVLIWQGII